MQTMRAIQQRIQAAAERAGRSVDEITLVAVSKTRPIADLEAAYAAGVRHFGENRSAEFAEKVQALCHLPDIRWHFIGHLQTRQSQPIAQSADYFHAVDREKIAQRLSRQLHGTGRTLPVFIEMNVSGEQSKGGFQAADWEQDARQQAELVQAVGNIAGLPHLQVLGLMTMAPFRVPEGEVRSVFRRLRQLSGWLHQALPGLNAPALSMGMSDDFETAIEEGATHVRVGSAIFGGR
ncbi:MAG: YggS family pyridoxal phosphate-dependent enzyme [Pseudomonadota bacterium]